jgi:hypothetical protein
MAIQRKCEVCGGEEFANLYVGDTSDARWGCLHCAVKGVLDLVVDELPPGLPAHWLFGGQTGESDGH